MKEAPNWQPVTSEELKAFLAMLIISNDSIVVPRDKRYFLSCSETRLFTFHLNCKYHPWG